MCRYIRKDYRTHWACVPCRYTDKRPKLASSLRPAPTCPFCAAPMLDLGRDFHAPRRRNAAQWRKIGLLVADGVRFDSCGCTGPGARPRTLADAKRERRLRGRVPALRRP